MKKGLFLVTMLCLLVSYFPELSFAGPVYEVDVNEACPPDPDVIAEQLRQEQAEDEIFLRERQRNIRAIQQDEPWFMEGLRLFEPEGTLLISDDEDYIL